MHLRIRLSAHDSLAHALHSLAECEAALDLGAQGNRVDEIANDGFQLGSRPIRPAASVQ